MPHRWRPTGTATAGPTWSSVPRTGASCGTAMPARPGQPRLEAARPLIGPSPVGWGDDEKRRPGEWGLRVKPCVVDWDGDGRLDILLGDRCGGFRDKPAQSDLEKDEERRANDRLPELRRKWAVAFRTFRELAEPPAGETTAAGQERLRLREASRHEMVRYKEEIATVQSIQERYQPGYQSHGFVWIFLASRAPAAENGKRNPMNRSGRGIFLKV